VLRFNSRWVRAAAHIYILDGDENYTGLRLVR